MRMGNLVAGCCLLAGLVAWPNLAQAAEPPSVGERVDQVLGELKQGARAVGSRIEKGWHQFREQVDQLGVEGRVYARLRWDKALEEASISVDANKEGLVVLRGTVRDAAAKTRAEELAGTTVGVSGVRSELAIDPGRP